MDISSEIQSVELGLRELARSELIEHQRHRDLMVEIRDSRACLEAKLAWLDGLKKQGLREIA